MGLSLRCETLLMTFRWWLSHAIGTRENLTNDHTFQLGRTRKLPLAFMICKAILGICSSPLGLAQTVTSRFINRLRGVPIFSTSNMASV